MSTTINTEKDNLKRIFRTLDACTLSARSEEIIASLEDFYHERGYLSPKQKELLMDIYEKAET
jgi:NADH:ubiquinone oxidoreductase subunit E